MKVPFVDLPSMHQDVATEVEKAMLTIARNGHYILGDAVEKFEKSFARYCATPYCVGVASGTDGLLLALRSLNIGPGDEVITTPHTFIASALPISYVGARVVLADIDPQTYNIDPSEVEKKITNKTKAIIAVALYGQPPDMKRLRKIAKKHSIKLIIDACQAHGATYDGNPIATLADITVFSFYPTKNLGAYGDGGAVVTSSKRIFSHVQLLRNVGRGGWYEHIEKGYNSRLDALQAAILSVKLKKLPAWIKMRQKVAATYDRLLTQAGEKPPYVDPAGSHVYYLYIVETDRRKDFIAYLKKHGIDSMVHYPIPVHLQPAYKELGLKQGSFPHSEHAADSVVSLPFFPHMKPEQQQYVVDVVSRYRSLPAR